MPTVTLVSYTGHGHPDKMYAAKLLAFTKNTRLNMTPEGVDSFMEKSVDEIINEINYMATTIPSSWEFVDLIFSIEGVSRATAQQITRTRTASFAMQSQRVSDMSNVTWDKKGGDFDATMERHISDYSIHTNKGMSLEDARELLPIGVHCNLIGKYNLRGLVELCRARDSLRVQEAYRVVCLKMKERTLLVWPWAEDFFTPPNKKAIDIIEKVAIDLAKIGNETGAMYKGLSGKLAKAADLIKKG